MSSNFASNNLTDGILAAFAVRHDCPIIYSCRKRRFGEDMPYAKICNHCGGYQRYKCSRLPVLHEDVADNSHELLRFGELTINPTNSPCSPNSPETADEEVIHITPEIEEKLNELCVEIDMNCDVYKAWFRNNKTKVVDGVNGPTTSYVESFNGGRGGGGDGCGGSGASGINGSG